MVRKVFLDPDLDAVASACILNEAHDLRLTAIILPSRHGFVQIRGYSIEVDPSKNIELADTIMFDHHWTLGIRGGYVAHVVANKINKIYFVLDDARSTLEVITSFYAVPLPPKIISIINSIDTSPEKIKYHPIYIGYKLVFSQIDKIKAIKRGYQGLVELVSELERVGEKTKNLVLRELRGLKIFVKETENTILVKKVKPRKIRSINIDGKNYLIDPITAAYHIKILEIAERNPEKIIIQYKNPDSYNTPNSKHIINISAIKPLIPIHRIVEELKRKYPTIIEGGGRKRVAGLRVKKTFPIYLLQKEIDGIVKSYKEKRYKVAVQYKYI